HALKKKLGENYVVTFFENPQHLSGKVFESLLKLKEKYQKERGEEIDKGELWAKKLHAHANIPLKPDAFIAHPYTLLQVKGLIGRKWELEVLTDWITRPQYRGINIFNIVAIGGMGKSALTWTWFHKIAPQEKKWAGQIWWSFYETDAHFDNFIIHTLAYVSGKPKEEIKHLPYAERQSALLHHLNNEPYLIVLDGLERILVAYARQDAAFLNDDTALDDQTANWIAGMIGLPESGAKSFVGRHRLRKTTDPRIGHFLRQLSQIRNSKILVSTRLYPADLQTSFGDPYPGCNALFLEGLSDPDALELWRTYGAKGSREEMLPVFRSFDKHPLLLQLLSAEVAEHRPDPGNFDAWKKDNPEFNVFGLPLVQVQSHVLSYALRGLSQAELRT
ncbi:MAG: ATP-binding protein, partial [Bacteroidetes bacterium]|nr:ATP-binding protein [Bacteroidota bacterium]